VGVPLVLSRVSKNEEGDKEMRGARRVRSLIDIDKFSNKEGETINIEKKTEGALIMRPPEMGWGQRREYNSGKTNGLREYETRRGTMKHK